MWGIAFVKGSILAFYWRIFKVSSIRKWIFIVVAAVVAWTIACVSLPLAATPLQARDINSAKDLCDDLPMHLSKETLGHNSGRRLLLILVTFFLGTAVPEVVTDFAILAMPLPYIWQLQVKTRQKVVLTMIFVAGGLYVSQTHLI